MWFERFVIIVTSIHRDYIPSSWTYFSPTWVDIGIFIGTMGIFMTCFVLFCKFMPVVALAEVKMILKSMGDQYLAKTAKEENMEFEKYKNVDISGLSGAGHGLKHEKE